MNQQILDQWNEIKSKFEEAEIDLTKNAKGNKAAGVRFRKQAKNIEVLLKNLKKDTINISKD